MKNWNRVLFGLCISLLGLASCGGKGNNTELSDFKIEDTASIDSIFLADKGNRMVLLSRDNQNASKWWVNHEFPARPDLLSVLLTTIRRVEVRQFVPKQAVSNVLKTLAVAATKVEIYADGKMRKVYYVGGPTQDHYGTYMLLEGSDVPFICYVPGFRGYLTNHFTPFVEEWKDRKIFNYNIDDIGTVQVNFARQPENSYQIKNIDNKSFKLYNAVGAEVPNFDTSAVKEYLRNFKVLGFEAFLDVNKARLDSVRAKHGLYTVTVTEKSGRIKSVQLFEIPLQPGTLNMLGEEVSVDVDRMYGIVDGKTIVLAQYFTFDPVTVPIQFFVPALQPKPKL